MNTRELILQKEQCCGCEMCAFFCPTSAITMVEDEEGFVYPEINSPEKCIDCKKCYSVCPMKVEDEIKTTFINYYAGSFKDDEQTKECSSGGMATAIERSFIEQGGVVYGVAYSEDWKAAEYVRVDDTKDVECLKTSKYVQAKKCNLYNNLIEDLENGIKCLFIGLPCDVLAIKKNFAKYQDKLYTIELICHGPTSNRIQKEYCECIEKKFDSTIVNFSVRYKKDGNWKPYYIRAVTKSGKVHRERYLDSCYGTAFKYFKRPSCYICKIKGNRLCGDLMIGDYHYVEKGMPGYNRCGVSSALSHNEKGNELLSNIKDDFDIIKIPKKNAEANIAIFSAVSAPESHYIYRETLKNEGLMAAHNLSFVKKSNRKRRNKALILKVASTIKRLFQKCR